MTKHNSKVYSGTINGGVKVDLAERADGTWFWRYYFGSYHSRWIKTEYVPFHPKSVIERIPPYGDMLKINIREEDMDIRICWNNNILHQNRISYDIVLPKSA